MSPKNDSQLSDSDKCNYTAVCGCNYAPCTCGNSSGTYDCVPYINATTGRPYYCNSTTNCEHTTYPCPDCSNFEQFRFKLSSESNNHCNTTDFCECVACECGEGKDC